MNTALVQAVLNRLALAEVAWAPRFVGIEHGDEILSWLPGAPMHDWASAPERLDGLTVIVRQLHDLTVGWVPGVECVVHDDLQPRNVVVAPDGQLGLIDWEQCRGGHRIEDRKSVV